MAEESGAYEATHWLPEEASIVALVRQREGGAWAAGVAVGLADIVGRRRGRTFLANTVPGATDLDGLMEASGQPGLTRALSGELAMSEVARSAPRQSFAYLPAGEPALSLPKLREIPAFRGLLKRVAERGGTLLLYVAEEDLAETFPDPDHDLPVDGCIAIGDIDDLALMVGAPLLARVERPSGVPAASDGAAGESPVLPADIEGDVIDSDSAATLDAGVSEARKQDRRVPAWAPWLGVAAGLLLAWLAWGSLNRPEGSDAIESAGSEPELAAETGDGAESSSGDPGDSGDRAAGAGADGSENPEPRTGVFSGPELPYSVLVASFARPEDAERHMAELDADAALFIVAPTPIRDRTYYRILAGAVEDRVEAEELMGELVDAGLKQEIRGWDVRPVRFAFDLGVYQDRRASDRRIGQLSELGIYAYRLADGLDEPRAWRVYAGAYETRQAAAEFGTMLTEAGEPATLIPRTGRPR
ncbi:MAG: SPOR domain-containing protein [marine benthic group bacterium]|nr:SPOR domain-containing protein [Gemmatimonadota bacterium]MCL7937430.1 SPOR domain-containing protein [Gemmatimonadota bacterium]